jgi:hypothetical protein
MKTEATYKAASKLETDIKQETIISLTKREITQQVASKREIYINNMIPKLKRNNSKTASK